MSPVLAAMSTPWVISAVLAVTARRMGRLLSPSFAVRMLSATGLSVALAGGFALAVLAFTLLAQNVWIAKIGCWSPTQIRSLDPVAPLAFQVAPPVGLAAGVVVIALFVAAVVRAVRAARALWLAGVACRQLGSGTAGMIVVEDGVPDAYALPGIAGRIVVTTAMLEALTPAERRVLLAHEASHLRHHHYLYLLLADVSAAANPLLRTTAAAVHLGVERWADDDAASEVADRQLAARAVARAALARAAHPEGPRPATAMLMAAGPVVDRTRALLAPPLRPHRLVAAALVALMLGTAGSAVAVERITEKRFEQAQSDWHR